VADDLGAAVLLIEVDDSKARKSIDALRQAVENFKPEFKGVERALTNIASQADKAKVQVQTLNQTLNQAPGASYSKISAQIGRLIAQSRELKIQSEQYIQTLQRIRELEFVRSARAGRQRTTADFGAAQGATLTRGFGAEERLPTLPPTIAGDLQKLNELNFRLKNLEVGSSAFELTLRQIEAVQKRVADATEGSSEAFRRQEQAAAGTERRLQKLAQIQQYYADINPRAGGTRDPNTGAMLARGAGAAADERAYRASLRAAQQLLDVDLKRLQTIRQLSQQLGRASAAREASLTSGFGAFSASIGSPDPAQKAIRRATERRAQQEERRAAQLDALDADLARVREQRVAAERNALRTATRAPERGRLGALGAPLPVPPLPRNFFGAQRTQLNRRRQDIASNALIGGAFPLLFGQGIGASLGGAAGGAGGGAIGGQFGFGLSLLGTAVGAQFDAIIQKSTVLGNALSNPIARFGELQQAGILSSKGLERQVESLIAVGREAEAAALIQQDLANSYGGAENAKRLADEQDRLNRSWSEFSLNLAQTALPTLAAGAEEAARALRGLNEILKTIGSFVPPGVRDVVTPRAGDVRRPFFSPISPGFGASVIGAVLGRFAPSRPTATGGGTTPQTAESEAKRTALLSSQYKLITAQVQGYKDLALRAERRVSLEQEALDIANLRARRAGQPEIDARRTQGAQERFRIEEQLQQLGRDAARTAAEQQQKNAQDAAQRASTLRLISSETEIQAGAIERQLQNAQALAQVEAGILRDALAQRQAIEESTASAVERERALRAELGEAQALGDETAIFRATTQLYLAAGQTKLALIDGARALSDSGRSLRDNILNAQRSIRSTLEGSFDLLQAPIQQQLLEQARGRINFSLFDVGRVRTPGEIFGAAAASESIAAQQQAIAQSNTALIDVNSALVKVLGRLADKKWDVAVNVLGASGAQVIGDVVGATA
jgi:hypothetical protein